MKNLTLREEDWQNRQGSCTVLMGNNLKRIKDIPDKSVQCVVTSPPYWGLRDYGTGEWKGGDPNCKHEKAKIKSRYDYSLKSSPKEDANRVGTDAPKWKKECPTCGAKRVDYQIGNEDTPAQFVEKMVKLFREVRRILRDDGTVFLNLGDTYSSKPAGNKDGDVGKTSFMRKNRNKKNLEYRKVLATDRMDTTQSGLASGNLVGIPWRVALALQEDGWMLRQDIIWHKPGCMPSSVTNRCTTNHEYIFLLTKSMKYFYDADAIKEKAATPPHSPGNKKLPPGRRDVYRMDSTWGEDGLRNKRSVWTISVASTKDEHFAVFPRKLPLYCILAGTSKKGCCPHCGAPWRRVTEKERVATRPGANTKVKGDSKKEGNRDPKRHVTKTLTSHWEQTCDCKPHEPVPCVVFDPFLGSGTVAEVALSRGRHAIGCELNPQYLKFIQKRVKKGERRTLFTI